MLKVKETVLMSKFRQRLGSRCSLAKKREKVNENKLNDLWFDL
jgi:hypothetical protein